MSTRESLAEIIWESTPGVRHGDTFDAADRVIRWLDANMIGCSNCDGKVVLALPNGALSGWPTLIDTLRRGAEATGLSMTFGDLIRQIEERAEKAEADLQRLRHGLTALADEYDASGSPRLIDAGTIASDLRALLDGAQ